MVLVLLEHVHGAYLRLTSIVTISQAHGANRRLPISVVTVNLVSLQLQLFQGYTHERLLVSLFQLLTGSSHLKFCVHGMGFLTACHAIDNAPPLVTGRNKTESSVCFFDLPSVFSRQLVQPKEFPLNDVQATRLLIQRFLHRQAWVTHKRRTTKRQALPSDQKRISDHL